MAFKHLDSRQVSEAQWDHVESLGVRDSYDGSLFDRSWEEMTVDEKRLCLGSNAFYFDVEENYKGKVRENNFEEHWNIVRIEFPDGWSFDSLSVEEFKQITTEAFTAETYRVYSPSMVKLITVDFSCNLNVE